MVATTKEDLERASAEGRFRQSLYYRLNVVQLHVPPLRERGNDVALLFQRFLRLTQRSARCPGMLIRGNGRWSVPPNFPSGASCVL